MRNKLNRITIFILGGLLLGIIICSILITISYFSAHNSTSNSLTVNFLTLEIYELYKDGEGGYSGKPNNENMIFIGMVFSFITVFVGEIIYFKKIKM